MAAPNFIMGGNSQLRATNFIPDSQYDIGELNFYVSSNTPSTHQVFLILTDQKKMVEIIELQKVGTQGNNILYKVPLNQTLRIKDGQVLLSIMILDGEHGTYDISSKYAVNITIKQYELARQVYIVQNINAQTQSAYAKILAMTEENRKIYNEIKERG